MTEGKSCPTGAGSGLGCKELALVLQLGGQQCPELMDFVN